jgi:hypothetical protein
VFESGNVKEVPPTGVSKGSEVRNSPLESNLVLGKGSTLEKGSPGNDGDVSPNPFLPEPSKGSNESPKGSVTVGVLVLGLG